MAHHLLETKFHIPPWREQLVTRTRLLDRLRAGLAQFRKLTLVSAPAGYGKTTLIVDWIHSLAEDSGVIWISLDSGDNDLARFLGYWLSAFRRVDEAVGQSALRMLDLPKLPPLESILTELLNDLIDLEGQAVLVLDDYHTIVNPQIHAALEYFIEHQPAQIHLVVITREDPPLPLARMRARGQMTEIRAHDLRFNLEETKQFFGRSMHLKLAEETVTTLEARTEGWAVGLQLAALALQNLPNPQVFVETFHGTHRFILDYLAEEVLRQQDKEIRDFLFQTAVLEEFNAPLCNAVTGRSDSQALLSRLEQANLFLIPLDNERFWYRYHHLFADYLRTGLSKTEQARLHEQASGWYEENDLVFEAVKHAFLSENLEMTANVIERVIQKTSAWTGGEIAKLVEWLDALPGQILQSKPALCLHAARAWYIVGRIGLSEKYLDLAETSLRERPTPDLHTNTLLAIAAERRASLAVLRGDLHLAIERATYAQNHLPEEKLYDRARAGAMLGLAYGLKGDLVKASHLLIEVSDLAQTAGVSFMTLVTRCEAAVMHINQGRLHLAAQTVQQAIQLAGGKQIPSLGYAWYVLAEISWERNELSAAEKYLIDGIEISRQGVLVDDLRYELMTLAHLKKSTGDLATAMSAMEQAHAICQSFEIPRLTVLSGAHFTRIQLAAGLLGKANQWAQEYQELRRSHPVEYTREYEDLTLARVYLANGEYDPALEILNPLFKQAEAAGRTRTCIEAAILLSLGAHAQNKIAVALQWLAKAITLAEPEGFLRVCLDEGPLIAEMLPKVRQASPGFVDQILHEFSKQTQRSSQKETHPINDRLIDPLSEQELRVLDLIIMGKSNQEIATALVISAGTAKWHVHNVLQKLGVNNRPQAIALARQLGMGG